MKPEMTKIVLSILLLIMGLAFIFATKFSLEKIHFSEKDYKVTPNSIRNYRIGGAIIAILGIYYLLSVYGFLPSYEIRI